MNIAVTVSPAHFADIPGILTVLKQNLIGPTNPFTPSSENTGFLIHSFTAEEVAEWIKDEENAIVLVSKKADGVVVGYAVSFNLEKLPQYLQDKFLAAISNIDKLSPSTKILYYRHIAKTPGEKQIGKALLESVLHKANLQNYQYVVCQIVHEPVFNLVSAEFHKKMGFCLVTTYKDGNLTLGIYFKKFTSI